jgi:hypothetical protein
MNSLDTSPQHHSVLEQSRVVVPEQIWFCCAALSKRVVAKAVAAKMLDAESLLFVFVF